MEPAIRSPRIEPSISTDRARNNFPFWCQKLPRFPSSRTALAAANPTAGNGIFGCRDGRLKSARETASATGDRKSRKIPAETPAETACCDSAWKSVVWSDWLVVCAVRYEPVSLLFSQYQGLFRKKQRSGRPKCQKALQHRHFPDIATIQYQGRTGSALQQRAGSTRTGIP
jgi:hypothetical protein